jgi:UDP-N-acetylmuramate--alanine ligase
MEKIKNIHLIGIGGIGMSGIAEIMNNLKYNITGSDQKTNSNVRRLKKNGIKIFIGHKASNISDSSLIVYSSAIPPDNCELLAAKDLKIPIIGRSEMLRELMRMKKTITVAGSHGKTTAVSIIAEIFDYAKHDPTVINGGIINSYGSNTKLGESDLMLVETDESDGSFSFLPSFAGVITSIDNEHIDYYGSKKKLLNSFLSYCKNISPFGFLAVSEKDINIKKVIKNINSLNIYKYGFSDDCDFKGEIIREDKNGILFNVLIKSSGLKEVQIKNILFPMLGGHNIENALAAITIAYNFNIKKEDIKKALQSFKGVRRRLSKIYENNNIIFYDDYAHHPTEIKETIRALKLDGRRLISVIQPHRYTRLRDTYNQFKNSFSDSDYVFILPVYEAGEDKIDGINSEVLANDIVMNGHPNAIYLDDFSKVKNQIKKIMKRNDTIIFMGAGSISSYCNIFAEEMILRDQING